MAGTPTYTVKVRGPGGKWTELGTDSSKGIYIEPESVSHSHVVPGGSDTLDFTLKRNANVHWPDLRAGSEIHVTVDNVDAWSGRVAKTPRTSGDADSINVQCEGWIAHLDDDLTDRFWVHDDLTQWVDARDYENTLGAVYGGQYNIQVSRGAIKIEAPRASVIGNGVHGAVVLDLGPNNYANALTLTYFGGGDATAGDLAVFGKLEGNTYSSYEAFTVDAAPLATASTTASYTFASSFRYFEVRFGNLSGGVYTVAAGSTYWACITSIKVFQNSTLRTGSSSNLTAGVVARDVLTDHCPKIDVAGGSFATGTATIPHYPSVTEYRSPAEVIEEVTNFDGLQFLLRPSAKPTPVLRSVPTTPKWVVRASDATFQDAGSNDLSQIYNRVRLNYTNAANQTYTIDRRYGEDATTWAFTNPGAEVNTTGWSVGNGTLARDTVLFQAGVASFTVTNPPGAASTYVSTSSFNRQLIPGENYRLSFWMRVGTKGVGLTGLVLIGDPGGAWSWPTTGANFTDLPAQAAGAWREFKIDFIAGGPNLRVQVQLDGVTAGAGTVFNVDNFLLTRIPKTYLDRLGYDRVAALETSVPLSSTTAQAIADAFLRERINPPFSGSATLYGTIENYKTGDRIPVGQVTAGDMVLFADEPDPNTGGMGRTGIITETDFSLGDNSLTITVEKSHTIFDLLVRRMSTPRRKR